MIKNILLKDLKRKKTMNIIILMFIILTTMFVASSVNNIVTIMNGTGYFFEQADLGNYVAVTLGEDVWGNMDAFLENEKALKDYRLEDAIFLSKENVTKVRKKDKNVTLANMGMIQSLADCKQKFFDENNQVVNQVESGYVYTTSTFMKDNNLKIGDKIRIQHGDCDQTFEIKGRLKDALFGSSFLGNARFLVSHDDYQKFYDDEYLHQYYGGQICYMDVTNEKAVSKSLGDVENIAFSPNAAKLKMFYVMDMIVAGILIVVSVCLIIVAFVVLKFTITFTLAEEFREIGVMKAIGIKNGKIRSIYVIKYLAMAIVGAIIGFFGSIPFGEMLIKSASDNMVLGNNGGVLFNVASAIVVVLIIVGYAYRCTGKLKKYSPIDAIRSGQTGERYKKKTVYRIGKSHFKPSVYMALNDVISSPKRYMTIIAAFSICTLLVLLVVNTTETMKSDKLLYAFAKRCDAYMDSADRAKKGMTGEGHTAMEEVLDDINKELKENGYDAKSCIDVQFKYKTEFDGEEYSLNYQQGFRTKASDYVYYEGEAPKNAHEIAITETVSKNTGAKIGDSFKITMGNTTDEYVITAYFQTMNQFGDCVRLHEDAPTELRDSTSAVALGVDFADDVTPEEIDKRVEKMKKIFDCDEVYSAKDFTAASIGVVDMLEGVAMLLLLVTIIVVILVTILMERSFISDEKSEIAILKAVGFSNGSILKWHVTRFVIVGVIAVFIAVILSIPATNLCISPIFSMMGMSDVEYEYNLVQMCLVYPLVVLAVTLIAATLTALYTKTIQCSDTASIE